MHDAPPFSRVPLPPELSVALAERFGPRYSTSRGILLQHGQSETLYPSLPPDAVIFVHSTEEVQFIVRQCVAHRTPIIPFGVGTSVEGNFAAIRGGVCVDFSQMNQILRVSAEDLDCTVQAGVRRVQLNQHLRDQGLFFPPDPGADATIGGMASTRASGTNAVLYGTMRENVLALTVVTPSGNKVITSRRARKSSAGYDLTHLFVGAEGTLGLITEVTLKLHGVPEHIGAAICAFDSLDGAVRTVVETMQMGIPIARAEILDDMQMKAVNRWSKTDLPERSTLFLEFHGSERSVDEQVAIVGSIARQNGGGEFQWSATSEERTRLWKARHDAFYAAVGLRPGARGWATDVCVPISRLAECISLTKQDIARSAVTATILGHVGDGNFHVIFVIDPASSGEIEEAARINDALVKRAIEMEGTCTGEHGIGLGKQEWLKLELGDAVDLMRDVKQALDPLGLMNPGKIFQQ